MTPRLQLALDTSDIESALAVLDRTAPLIDVIEVGTVLLFAEGLRAIRDIRARYPHHILLADARIAEAGSALAEPFFHAGADWVSCVSAASLATIDRVTSIARRYHGQVQIELGERLDPLSVREWRTLQVEHVIVKRSRDSEGTSVHPWGAAEIARIRELHDAGFTVTVTGGITPEDLSDLGSAPVGIIIAGRFITAAPIPEAAAAALRTEIARVWP